MNNVKTKIDKNEPYFPEARIHDFLCHKNIIAGNPEIAPAIYLGKMTLDDINILFSLEQAKEHCKKECRRDSCEQIIALFSKERTGKPEPTLY